MSKNLKKNPPRLLKKANNENITEKATRKYPFILEKTENSFTLNLHIKPAAKQSEIV